MKALKDFGTGLLGILALLAVFVAIAFFFYGFAWVSEKLMWYIFSAVQITFAVCVVLLLPLSIFRATRKVACFGLYGASFIFGACTWIMGFSSTYFYWGGFGVMIGLILGIVGIVPLGILASLMNTDWYAVAFLVGGLVLTYGARAIALWLADKIDRYEMGKLEQA